MLCDECRHTEVPCYCDYDGQTDTCRRNKDKQYPELAMYDDDQTDLLREPDDVSANELGRYEIVFEVNGHRYYCFADAVNMGEALGQFFKEHPHITYAMVVEHMEV